MITGSGRIFKSAGELPGLVLAAGFATLAAIAVVGAKSPMMLVAAPIGGIGLMYAARRPLLAVCSMVVIEVTNVSGVLSPHGGIPFFQVSMLLGILAIGFAIRDPEVRSRINAWTGICAALLGVYLATQAVATIGSVDRSASIDGMRRFFLDCLFVMVLMMLIQLTQRPWTVAAVLVIPLALLSLLTVINEVVYGGTVSFGGFATVTTASGEMVTTLRYGGPLPDSNFWGRHLVMALPFATALLTRSLRVKRWLEIGVWATSVLMLLAGVYLTQSRGTFLAAGAAVAIWFVASDRSVRRKGLVYFPLVLLVFAVPGVGNRLILAFQDVMTADENSNVDPSVLGRLSAQQQAWMMFGERPAFGFGPSTFPELVISYAGRVETAVLKPALAPHNLYAEFACTSGINGLLGWAVVIFGFLGIAVLGIVANPQSKDRIFAAAVLGAIVAWSAASIGLHLAYFRTFGVTLALVAAVAPEWPVPAQAFRTVFRGLWQWGIAGVVGAVGAATAMAATSVPAYIATQQMTLTPIGDYDGWYAYALDIRSRAQLLPSFSIMMADPSKANDITADPVRGVLTFTATADSPQTARDQVQYAISYADMTMHTAIGYQQYSLQPVAGMTIEPVNDRSKLATLGAAGVGLIVAVFAGVVFPRLWERRRRNRVSRQMSPQELTRV